MCEKCGNHHLQVSANATFLQWVQVTRALSHDDMEEFFDQFGHQIEVATRKAGASLNTHELIQQFKLTLAALVGNRGMAVHGYHLKT